MEKDNTGYIYAHITLDTNEVFYIGCSFGAKYLRAKSKYKRTENWVNIANTSGYKIEILKDNINIKDLLIEESKYILYYKNISPILTNKILGNGINQTPKKIKLNNDLLDTWNNMKNRNRCVNLLIEKEMNRQISEGLYIPPISGMKQKTRTEW